MNEAGDVISLFDAALVDVADDADDNSVLDDALVIVATLTEVIDLMSVTILVAAVNDSSPAVPTDVIDAADISTPDELVLVIVTALSLDVTYSVPVTMLVDVADINSLFDVADAVDNSLLPDVAAVLVGVRGVRDVGSLLDDALVTVTVLKEVRDLVSATTVEDAADVSPLLVPVLVDMTEDISSTLDTALVDLCVDDSADVSSLLDVELVVVIAAIEVTEIIVLVLVAILEDVADASSLLDDAATLVGVTDGVDVSSLSDVVLVTAPVLLEITDSLSTSVLIDVLTDIVDVSLISDVVTVLVDVANDVDDTSLLDDALVIVTTLIITKVTDLVSPAIPIYVAGVSSSLDPALVDVVDSVAVSLLLDVPLVISVTAMEVTEIVLVVVAILEDVADVSSLLDPVLVSVTDAVDVNLLSDVAAVLVGTTDVRDVISLLDNVLVILIALIEVTDFVPISILVDVEDVSSIIDASTVLEGVNEAGDVISLLDATLVDVTDAVNDPDDSSLFDNALVTVIALLEVME